MITTVLFDLDGTLLPLDQDKFLHAYSTGLAKFAAPYGYAPEALVDALWKGCGAMIRNDGTKYNREVFWDLFAARFGEEARTHEKIFERYYATEFENTRETSRCAPESRKLIDRLKARGIRCILATNPLFPQVATYARIRWAGLKPEDFDCITTYEDWRHCKPDPAYFADLLAHIGADPSECLMIGNDASDDVAAMELGIPVFLLTPCLINAKNRDISELPHGGFAELNDYLAKILPE